MASMSDADADTDTDTDTDTDKQNRTTGSAFRRFFLELFLARNKV